MSAEPLPGTAGRGSAQSPDGRRGRGDRQGTVVSGVRGGLSGDGPRRAIVLGSGGVLGFAWLVGALAALETEAGFDVRSAELLVGTSAGAVAGSLLACGASVDEIRRHHQGVPAPTDPPLAYDYSSGTGGTLPPRPTLRPGSPRLLLDAVRHPRRVRPIVTLAGALPTGRGTLEPIHRLIADVNARQLDGDWPQQPALWIAATDYRSGHRVVFGRDSAEVRSDAAHPGTDAAATASPRTRADTGRSGQSRIAAGPDNAADIDSIGVAPAGAPAEGADPADGTGVASVRAPAEGADPADGTGVASVRAPAESPDPTDAADAIDRPDPSDLIRGGSDPAVAVADAVIASCAIPAWYPPVLIGGRPYIDGGAVSNASVDLMSGLGMDEVYVFAPMASIDVDRPRSPVSRIERTIRRAVTRGIVADVEALRRSGTRVLLITPGPEDLAVIGANLMNPRRRIEVLETAMRTAAVQLRVQLAARSRSSRGTRGQSLV